MKARIGRLGVLIVAALTLSLVPLAATPSPADAAWADCPAGYNCWWRYGGGTGQRWQVQDNNPNLQRYGIATASGYNRRSGTRACGYAYTNYDGLNYGRPFGDTESYSLRIIQSNRFVYGNCN
jgi:hypothetical protein